MTITISNESCNEPLMVKQQSRDKVNNIFRVKTVSVIEGQGCLERVQTARFQSLVRITRREFVRWLVFPLGLLTTKDYIRAENKLQSQDM